MEITYQPIAQEDVEKIFALLKALILKYENLEQIDTEKVFPWCRKKIETSADSYRKIMADGHHAGYFAVHEENGDLELDDFYIFPQFQGKGIGTKVLGQLMERAERESKGLFLYVFIKNEGAVRLYERLGFGVAENIHDSRYIMRL